MAQEKITYGYWSIRGLAQPARLLLTYANIPFNDVQYHAKEGDRSEWGDVKFNLGLDFPNLPYIIDGDIKITQSNAILRYLGRKTNLLGENDKERAEVDMLIEQVMDFRNEFVWLCYGAQDFEKDKNERYLPGLPKKLEAFSKFLGEKEFLIGKITVPDFHFYEMLSQHQLFQPDCLNAYPNLQKYVDRFEAIPSIKQYLSSHPRLPCNNISAKWIGK